MSDVNLKRDSFFQSQMAKNDGYISVDVLLKCNKLKKLTEDAELIMSSLADSTDLEVSEDKKKVVSPRINSLRVDTTNAPVCEGRGYPLSWSRTLTRLPIFPR